MATHLIWTHTIQKKDDDKKDKKEKEKDKIVDDKKDVRKDADVAALEEKLHALTKQMKEATDLLNQYRKK